MRGIKLNIANNLPLLLKEAGFTNVVQEDRDADYTEKPALEPIPGTIAQNYINTATAMSSKAYEMGLISQNEWDDFKKGIREDARNLKKDYTIRSTVLVAQVRSLPLWPAQERYIDVVVFHRSQSASSVSSGMKACQPTKKYGCVDAVFPLYHYETDNSEPLGSVNDSQRQSSIEVAVFLALVCLFLPFKLLNPLLQTIRLSCNHCRTCDMELCKFRIPCCWAGLMHSTVIARILHAPPPATSLPLAQAQCRG